MALWSKAHPYSRLISGIAGSNSAKGMDVIFVFVLCCVGGNLCDELIACLENSCRMCVCVCVCVCLIVYDRSYTVWRPSAELAC